MTDAERAAILEKGKKCRARGCKCLARCFYVWNRYWIEKTEMCTHPNWCPADEEWWGDQPPFVGNKIRLARTPDIDNDVKLFEVIV